MGWRDIESDVATLLIKGVVFGVMAAVVISAVLIVVGETVEHFTP